MSGTHEFTDANFQSEILDSEQPVLVGIHSIPAVLLFNDGEVVETLIGVQPKQRYEDVLRKVAA